MLETIIATTTGESFTFINALIVIFASIFLGIITSCVYMYTNAKRGYNQGFLTTLIMLPVIISIIILLVGNNVARAFSLAGAFSIIRFRSAPGDPKDIAYIFFTLAVGLTCGMGYIGYAFVFTIILSALILMLELVKFGAPKGKTMQLKITVPEDLNYEGVFEEVLSEFAISYDLERVRTRDFGSLFELYYRVQLKPEANQKSFLDELRCRNGNLNISLTMSGFEDKAYN